MAATDFDYLATRNEIIEGAFRIIGVLEVGQNLTAEMLDQGVKALQILVKDWSNKHLFLWSFSETSFDTVSGQQGYVPPAIDTAILGIDKAYVISTDGRYIPISVITWGDYEDQYDKEVSLGQPLAIAFKPAPGPSPVPRFYLWPCPDAVYEIRALCTFPLEDFDTAGGSGDIPACFQRALKYGLAEDLFDEYPGPLNEREYVQQKAKELFRAAKNADLPSETLAEVAGFFTRYRG